MTSQNIDNKILLLSMTCQSRAWNVNGIRSVLFAWWCTFFINNCSYHVSATMMSWVRVWVDLFTTQFSDKVLLDTWKLIECE